MEPWTTVHFLTGVILILAAVIGWMAYELHMAMVTVRGLVALTKDVSHVAQQYLPDGLAEAARQYLPDSLAQTATSLVTKRARGQREKA